jgi:DNA-binding transcriptional LysR family regulator
VQLRRIRQFLAVADEGHFGRAAEVAGVSQPTLSEQVRKLEEGIGAVLLRRTPRSAGLTEAGAAFADRVRPAVVTIDDADASVGSRAAVRPLRVAYVDTITRSGAAWSG